MVMQIDGVPLAALGAAATELSGWLDGPEVERAVTPVPGLLGVLPSPLTVSRPRVAQLVVWLDATALTDRSVALARWQRAAAGLRRLRFDDTPGRVLRATFGAPQVESIAPRHAFVESARRLRLSVAITATDGASYDATPRVLVLGTTPTPIPLGTLPSTGVVVWRGTWSVGAARTLRYAGASGITYGELTLTPPTGSGGLGANDVLELDLARRYVTKVTAAGVRTNAYDWLTAGRWFALDDRDGLPDVAWPTLLVTDGTATLLYRRAYQL